MLSIDTQKPFAQEVKQQTEVQHHALEALIIPQIQAIQTRKDYARLLHLFYGYNKPLEEAIQKVISPTTLPDVGKRKKAHLIQQDLKSLGCNEELSVSADLPQIQSIEQAFGALYVLEGSTLGGKSISQLLLRTGIGLQIENLSFFNAYGKETGPMWMQFLSYLNRYTTEAQQATIIQTANETFLKFKHWIQQQQQVL